jgi:hypothetical protein
MGAVGGSLVGLFYSVVFLYEATERRAAKAGWPNLRRDGGAFIAMSSMGAKRGIPLQTALLLCQARHRRLPRGAAGGAAARGHPGQHHPDHAGHHQHPAVRQRPHQGGVKPVAPPPAYPPRIVADAIVHAAAHPVRDSVVGGAAKTLITLEKFMPRARRCDPAPGRLRAARHRRAEADRRTGQPRRTAHRKRQRGGQRRGVALRHSAYTWWAMHRPVSAAARVLPPPAHRARRLPARRRYDHRGAPRKPTHRRRAPLGGWCEAPALGGRAGRARPVVGVGELAGVAHRTGWLDPGLGAVRGGGPVAARFGLFRRSPSRRWCCGRRGWRVGRG